MPPKKAAPKKSPAAKKAPAAKAAPKKAPATKTAAKKAPAAAAARKTQRPASAQPPASAPPAKKAKVEAGGGGGGGGARPRVDEHCTLAGQVYMEGAIPWSVKLNQTNIGANNNKFYIIQLVESGSSYSVFTRWGRVGEPGQKAVLGGGALPDAMKIFCGKFKDKTKNDWAAVKSNPGAFSFVQGKYDLVLVDNSADAAAAAAPAVVKKADTGETVKYRPSKLPADLQAVLNLIFDKDMFNKQMKEKNIDADRMPLGKLTKAQVARGFEALEAIEAETEKAHPSREKLAQLSSAFYTIIPHDFGRRVPPLISTAAEIADKYDLLNMLGDIQIAVALNEAVKAAKTEDHPLDTQYKQLGCGLTPVPPTSAEYQLVDTYTRETQGYRKCRIRRLFAVDRPEDSSRMGAAHGKEGGRYLLWHGTNIAVVAAILKTGLRIMPHSGGRVGKGLYFASENGKSSAYVGCDGNTGIMFLVEVCMGDKIHRITRDDSSLNAHKVEGLKASSVLACGRTEPDPSKNTTVKGRWGPITVPQGKPLPQSQYKDSSFMQSEYLVYQESRARIAYMLEMDFGR